MFELSKKQKSFLSSILLDRDFKNFLRKDYRSDRGKFAYKWNKMEELIVHDRIHYNAEEQLILQMFRSDYIRYRVITKEWGLTWEEVYEQI